MITEYESIQHFLEVFDLGDAGLYYRHAYLSHEKEELALHESLFTYKLLRHAGKSAIGKRAGTNGSKIHEHHIKEKRYFIMTKKGEHLLRFQNL